MYFDLWQGIIAYRISGFIALWLTGPFLISAVLLHMLSVSTIDHIFEILSL